jgi:hypothetical protein
MNYVMVATSLFPLLSYTVDDGDIGVVQGIWVMNETIGVIQM